jgi:hypothetical protein
MQAAKHDDQPLRGYLATTFSIVSVAIRCGLPPTLSVIVKVSECPDRVHASLSENVEKASPLEVVISIGMSRADKAHARRFATKRAPSIHGMVPSET